VRWRMEITPHSLQTFKVQIQKRLRGNDVTRCAPTLDEALAAWRGAK
jgi:hypothetical protein